MRHSANSGGHAPIEIRHGFGQPEREVGRRHPERSVAISTGEGRPSARRPRRRLKIALLVDAIEVSRDDPQFEAGNDPATAKMEHHIAAGLRRLGHDVSVYPVEISRRRRFLGLPSERPDLCFNLVEQLFYDRRLSSNVPALLELLDIPYTGCSSIGISVALDKAGSKQILARAGLATPGFAVVPVGSKAPGGLGFPAIVKPRFGGGSEGITLSSVVHDRRSLAERVRYVHEHFRADAICEEFIPGRELSVGVLGVGRKATVLPVRETVFGSAATGGPAIATDRVKHSASYRRRWNVSYQRAVLDSEVEREVQTFCRQAFRFLELSGYVRFDLRWSERRGPVFLEVNPNPDLSPQVFGVMASWAGLDYEMLLDAIIGLAFVRRRAAA